MNVGAHVLRVAPEELDHGDRPELVPGLRADQGAVSGQVTRPLGEDGVEGTQEEHSAEGVNHAPVTEQQQAELKEGACGKVAYS